MVEPVPFPRPRAEAPPEYVRVPESVVVKFFSLGANFIRVQRTCSHRITTTHAVDNLPDDLRRLITTASEMLAILEPGETK